MGDGRNSQANQRPTSEMLGKYLSGLTQFKIVICQMEAFMRKLLALALPLALTLAIAVPARAAGAGWPCAPFPSCLFGPGPVVPNDLRPANVVVVDANEQQVGNVVGAAGSTGVVVALTSGDLVFGLRVRRTGFDGSSGGLLFTSFDCSGPPLIGADFDPTELFLRAVVFDELTVYLPNTAALATIVTTNSFRSAMGSDTGQCKTDGSPRSVYRSLAPIVLPFTPPFRVLFIAG